MEWYVEGCGGKLTHKSGSLTSPNYPKKYEHELTCLWEITVEYGFNIQVTIHDIDMEQSNSCEYDYLALSNVPNFNNSIAKICQSQHSVKVITSDGHKLFVKFNSDESTNSKGFNLTYESILSDCGGLFVGTSGIISTPKYPKQNYDNNKICEWNIKTDASHSIVFQLMDFDLEDSVNCTNDYLEVSDPIFNTVLWRGCGNQMPNQTIFKSQRNELNVKLKTNDMDNAKGFIGNFTNSCGARIVTNSSGEFQYQRNNLNTDCMWTIVSGDPSKKVVVTFTHVDIFYETETGCLSRVEVYDGDSDKGALKKAFCGSQTPPAIFSNGDALTIKLNTSALSFVIVFDIHYTVMDNGKASLIHFMKRDEIEL